MNIKKWIGYLFGDIYDLEHKTSEYVVMEENCENNKTWCGDTDVIVFRFGCLDDANKYIENHIPKYRQDRVIVYKKVDRLNTHPTWGEILNYIATVRSDEGYKTFNSSKGDENEKHLYCLGVIDKISKWIYEMKRESK